MVNGAYLFFNDDASLFLRFLFYLIMCFNDASLFYDDDVFDLMMRFYFIL